MSLLGGAACHIRRAEEKARGVSGFALWIATSGVDPQAGRSRACALVAAIGNWIAIG